MPLEVRAKYDYNSGHEDDLSFAAGQVITITEEVDEEWYSGQYEDSAGTLQLGMFPRNFVTVMTPENTPVAARKQAAGEETPTKAKPPEVAVSPKILPKYAPVPPAQSPVNSASSMAEPNPVSTGDGRSPSRDPQTSHQSVHLHWISLALTRCLGRWG